MATQVGTKKREIRGSDGDEECDVVLGCDAV
jgi:hypothetical protein